MYSTSFVMLICLRHPLPLCHFPAAGPTFSPEVLTMLDSKGLEVCKCCDITRNVKCPRLLYVVYTLTENRYIA